jgi:hypothetical protein
MPFNSDVLNGFKQPADSSSALIGGTDNQFFLYGSADLNGSLVNATKLSNVAISNDVTVYSAAGAISISGKAAVVGGTGFALTLAAPQEGCLVDILLVSISSGSVTVKTPTGVTFDGTNNTATFNAASDELIIGYKSATQWQIFNNISVTLSST